MTAADAARLNQAFTLLQQGRTQEAAAIANDVATKAPGSADALHLQALCRRTLGDDAGAAIAFEGALARAPNDARLLGNYANFLRRGGRLAEAVGCYRRALAIAPDHGECWMNLGLALRESGDPVHACEALERAVTLRPQSSPAWQSLAAARRALKDLDGAEEALRRAVSLDARNGAAWTSLGVVRRLLGDATDSLLCYANARRAGFTGPEIDDAEASAHLDLGEPGRALAQARRLIATAPAYVPGHSLLSRILWEHGATLAPDEDPRAAFRAAVAAQPTNTPLRLEYIRFLVEAGSSAEALDHIRDLRSREDTPSLMTMEAHSLEALGESVAAGALFAAAHAAMPSDPGMLNLYMRHLLKAREPELAVARALEALERERHNQAALAYLGVAWRLLGEAREHWLCDYERLVSEVAIEVPAGFSDEAEFLRALETTLVPLHTARRAPVNQSLRTGSQTSGVLFGRKDPVIVALRDALKRAVNDYVEALPDDATHPFLQRKSARTRFSGSWSVRLESTGHHINHFHQEGWISSAFYVSLPPSVTQPREGSSAGFIQFGEPPAELELGLTPRRVLQPRLGRLVLFPSYLWHGTVPYEDRAPRLTVAFDAIPAQLRHPSTAE
ncbi:MAG TPA: tetratricopeptide repeat protein [Steroidobacteraceae bacterium]|nr:tetratricopeptide repeat protein [Steroidobacteraceae bacterium]